MDNYKKFFAWLFGVLVAMVGFFLYSFYLKVDNISEKLNSISTNTAVQGESINNIKSILNQHENRLFKLETVPAQQSQPQH